MSKVLVSESNLQDIADAIREKNGSSDTYTPGEMSTAIENIPSGGSSHDWSAIGYSGEPQSIQDGYDYAVQVKNNWTTSSDYSRKFQNDYNITYMPLVNTINGTNFDYMFKGCRGLKTIPLLDTTNATRMRNMFQECYILKELPQFDCKNVELCDYFVHTCNLLESIPQLNFVKVRRIDSAFYLCSSLKNLGGFVNLGAAYSTTRSANYSEYTIDFSQSVLLTHDSLMNVINNLYDIATAGVQAQKLVLGSTNMAKLTAEEIAIATNKGWTVS